jgi:hypothetical protein
MDVHISTYTAITHEQMISAFFVPFSTFLSLLSGHTLYAFGQC